MTIYVVEDGEYASEMFIAAVFSSLELAKTYVVSTGGSGVIKSYEVDNPASEIGHWHLIKTGFYPSVWSDNATAVATLNAHRKRLESGA